MEYRLKVLRCIHLKTVSEIGLPFFCRQTPRSFYHRYFRFCFQSFPCMAPEKFGFQLRFQCYSALITAFVFSNHSSWVSYGMQSLLFDLTSFLLNHHGNTACSMTWLITEKEDLDAVIEVRNFRNVNRKTHQLTYCVCAITIGIHNNISTSPPRFVFMRSVRRKHFLATLLCGRSTMNN